MIFCRMSKPLSSRGLVRLLVPGMLLIAASAADAASCTISTPTFSFPNYNSLSSVPTAGFSSLSIHCALSMGVSTEGVSYAIKLSTGSSGNYSVRTFIGQPLQYNLYTNANHTQVWGDGSSGTGTLSGSLTLPGNSTLLLPVYGLIPARQPVETGTVSDHIIVTIDY